MLLPAILLLELLWFLHFFNLAAAAQGETAFNPNPECTDLPGWKDRNGYTCADYTSMAWCSNWWYGGNWSHSWGAFAHYALEGQVGADVACCDCGLARKPKSIIDCTLGEWEDWSICMSVAEDRCEQTRTRSVLSMPYYGQSCGSLRVTQPCQGCQRCQISEWGNWTCIANEVQLRMRQVVSSPSSPFPLCPSLGDINHTEGVCNTSAAMESGPVMQMSGSNLDGQFGISDIIQETTLISVGSTIGYMPIISVILGGYHTAVIAGTALLQYIFVTGKNNHGQLGLGDNVQRRNFTLLPLPSPLADQVSHVVLGYHHSMILTKQGLLYTCGAGKFGQLGLSSYGDRHALQQAQSVIVNDNETIPISNVEISSLAAGGYHSAFLTTDGIPFLFGNGVYGQLGHSSQQSQSIPKAVPFFVGFKRIAHVALGLYHSAFITNSSELYVVGDNSKGQLGLPSINSLIKPQLIDVFLNVKIRQVVLGFFHSTVLLHNGSIYTFGAIPQGQLNSAYAPVPKQVPFPPGVTIGRIATGWYTNAAIAGKGDLYTWGDNSYGQGGLGSQMLVPIPELVGTQDSAGPIINVAVGASHLAVLRLSTATATATAISTSSSTLSAEPTISTTPSISRSISETTSHSNFLTLTAQTTPSSTFTFTSSASPTSPPSLTPSFAACGPANTTLTTGAWTMMAGISCMQTVHLGPGSNVVTKRQVGVHLLSLPGPLTLAIEEGCGGSGNSDCHWHFNSADTGRRIALPLGSTASGSLEVFYGSGNATKYRVASSLAQVEFYLESSPGYAILIPVCIGSSAVAACLVGIGWWAFLRWTYRSRVKFWEYNDRLEHKYTQSSIAIGVWLTLTGVAWCIFVVTASHPDVNPIELLAVGIVLAVVGALSALLSWLWAMRDPQQLICTVCREPVSRWRFCGTYLPDMNNPFQHAKAHTQHILCTHCGKPVIDDRWPEAPLKHPYHNKCWEALCTHIVDDPSHISRWMNTEKINREPTEIELVHMLAAAVQYSSLDAIAELMAVSPSLPSAPISQVGCRTAMHLAASSGHLQALGLLLESEPQCLDPVCILDPDRPPSLSITGLEEGNDVYVIQPFLNFNNRAVYFGYAQGQYLYYYDPDKDNSKVRYARGWCLSSQLGSGSPPYRIPVPEATGVSTKKSMEKPHTRRRSQRQQIQRKQRRFLQYLASISSSGSSSDSGPAEAMGHYNCTGSQNTSIATEDLRQFQQNRPNPEAPPPSPIMTDPLHPDVHNIHTEEAMEVDAVFPPNIQIELLPHTTSLLEEAVSSAERGTILYVVELYKVQDPECVTWKYYTDHGLWEPFSAAAHTEIWGAMAQRCERVTLHTNEFATEPMTVDLARKCCWDTMGERPIQTAFRTVFQHQQSDDGPFEVTSNVATVLKHRNTIVVVAPGHVAVAATDLDILAMLANEGVVQCASWQPPVKMGGAIPKWDVFYEQMFTSILQQEVVQIMQVPNEVALFVQTTGFGGRMQSRQCRAETGIGSRLTDGLEQDQSNDQVAFYAPGYSSNEGSLPFCAKLPSNDLGLQFALESIIQMGMDAIMKIHELQRQKFPQKARHIVAVYVYSYELPHQYDGDDQIYGAMNKAMRLRIRSLIEFWRPLIWEIDVALQAFPPVKGKCFRGINCQISPNQYQNGTTICWPSFSSASQNQAVAEEFAKGTTGTLFFLTSVSAKSISAVSRYPEEAEVLFPPNSTFQVTTTLFVSSDIGAFYGHIDNVAMRETTGEDSPVVLAAVPRIRIAGHSSFLLHVPSEISYHILDFLSSAGIQVLQISADEDDPSVDGELLFVTEACYSPLPDDEVWCPL